MYEVSWGGGVIRVLVLNDMAKIKRNALWQMFSGVAEKVCFGAEQYHWRKRELSQYHNTRFNYYKQFMAYLKKLDTDAYPVFPNKSFLLFSHSTHRRQPGQDVAIVGSTCAVFGNLLDTE